MLTDAQCNKINTANKTHDYGDQAIAEYEAGLGDGINKFTERFELETGFTEGNDIGGIVVYMNGEDLVAFYDYENFWGCVF